MKANRDHQNQVSISCVRYRLYLLIWIEPDPTKVRTWTDRSKSFSVEAQFLALKDGKINLHKMNGVKIAVPVAKMSVEDLEYVERITGLSLDEDKPLSDIKRQRARAAESKDAGPSSGAGATIEHPLPKPEYDWFQFFLSCEVAVGLCERYSQIFNKDSMDESVLPDIDATVLRTLGIREGDIIKIMRFLDKKYGRTSAKRNVSFGGEEVISPDGESGGLFSGPGGTLKNNTRKGRPAPAVQTNDVVDPKAFAQDSQKKPAVHEGVATPLASVPTPAQKDVVRTGFDDDAWDVKPSKPQHAAAPSQPQRRTTAPAPAPAQPTLTGSMQELSLLSAPLEPIKAQPTAPPQISQPPQQQIQSQPQAVTPSFFAGISAQQTGLPQQQNIAPSPQFNPQMNQPNIARQRPAPPQQFPSQNQGSLMIPAPPSRPLSAPNANNQSGFSLPPLQPQSTGMQTSSGFQAQIAPPGQSLNDIRMQQQYTSFNGPQQNIGMMNQPQGFNQFPNGMQNGYQFPMQTGMPQQQTAFPQQNFMNNAGPFADPRPQQFSPIQQQPTGFQSSFPPQQYPQPTGVNSFLPPALQPARTGMQPQNGFNPTFSPPPVPPMPPMPPMPQQNTIQPLVPQKTGPPPPVRFGVTGDTKKLMPQATGRRANLAQASKCILLLNYRSMLTKKLPKIRSVSKNRRICKFFPA
jgi:DNA-directed RNA polymerase subunit H (RpoH/RPB5)